MVPSDFHVIHSTLDWPRLSANYNSFLMHAVTLSSLTVTQLNQAVSSIPSPDCRNCSTICTVAKVMDLKSPNHIYLLLSML